MIFLPLKARRRGIKIGIQKISDHGDQPIRPLHHADMGGARYNGHFSICVNHNSEKRQEESDLNSSLFLGIS